MEGGLSFTNYTSVANFYAIDGASDRKRDARAELDRLVETHVLGHEVAKLFDMALDELEEAVADYERIADND
jgi:hypothetical protein